MQDHPLRFALANELHARPFPTLSAPCTAVHIAFKQAEDAVSRDKSKDRHHLIELLDRHGAPHPQPDATHYSGQIGQYELKWEQHTEFITYTAFRDGIRAQSFDPGEFDIFPKDWLERAPGQRITSSSLRVEPMPDVETLEQCMNDWFVPESLAMSHVLDGSAIVAGDFRIDPSGHLRFAVFTAPDIGQRRVGRIVQRLCEIETYKSMSMLGFARVQALSPDLGQLDGKLAQLMLDMTGQANPAEDTLQDLLATASRLETMAAHTAFRFGATSAYEAIVNQRILALRERRYKGRQSFAEFMMRRYEPAMRTVKSTEERLSRLADRAMRAGDLLRTRVDVERSAQNQSLLASMDERAALQLRLQHTVEGLSVVAISYYAVSLCGYLVYPLAKVLNLSKGELTAAITLPVVGAVWWMVRRIRRKIG